MQIEATLQKFGLSEKEAKVYLALLELGTSIVSDVSKKSHINRSTSYVLLESLGKLGLVSITDKKGIRYYTPAPPERIVHMLEETLGRYSELIGVAKGLLPELKSMYIGVGPKPKIQYLEGVEGIKTAYEDTLTSQETIRAYASIEDMHGALRDYFPSYYNRRAAKHIHIRAVFPDTEAARDRVNHDAKEERTAYLVPSDEYAFSPEINIYDNKIVFMSLREKFALIIESNELADGLKKVFELSWKEAERLHQKHHGKKGKK